MKIPPWLRTAGSFLIVGLLLVVFLMPDNLKTKPVVDSRFTHPLTIGTTVLSVAYATTPHEQQQGLSGTSPLASDHGMLFLFPGASAPSFWMKDMNYPLDIIWIGADKTVVDISKNLDPKTYPATFSSKVPAQYVLEVPARFSDLNSIKEGMVVSF